MSRVDVGITEEQQKYLLTLSRKTLERYFYEQKKCVPDTAEIDSKLQKPAACFVTLSMDGKLRGCVGELEPRQPLYEAVINNTLSAAFDDNRFMPLSRNELESINIEISVLGPIVQYKTSKKAVDILAQITTHKHGVVLENGFNKATFLPQVWDEVPDKVRFLALLSQKAGLSAEAWKSKNTILSYYIVEHFRENR